LTLSLAGRLTLVSSSGIVVSVLEEEVEDSGSLSVSLVFHLRLDIFVGLPLGRNEKPLRPEKEPEDVNRNG